MRDKEAKWLASLGPGDKVFIPGRSTRQDRIARVERVTKTQIILKRGSRYNRETGRSIGTDTWTTTWIRKPTKIDEAAIRRQRAIDFLNGFDFSKLSDGALLQIYAIVKEKLDAEEKEQVEADDSV